MKNKIVFFGIALLIISALGQAKPIEVTVTPGNAMLNAGSSVEFTVVVTNTEAINENMGASVSGSAATWATISESSFSLPANGQKKLIVTLKPSAAAPAGDAYDLTVAVSTKDGLKWDTQTISPISIAQSGGGLRGFHEQPTPPIPVVTTTTEPPEPPTGLFLAGPSITPPTGGVFGLNLYYEPKMTTDRGFNLKDGDQCCVGDTVSVTSTGSGEFFGKAAETDSPPVVLVENLAKTIDDINTGRYKPQTYITGLCSYLWRCTHICPQCIGLSDCFCSAELGNADCHCVQRIAVICESPCKTSNFGKIAESTRNTFKVSDSGMVETYTTCVPSCILYYERGGLGRIKIGNPGTEWYAGNQAGGNSDRAVISSKMYLNAVTGTKGPDLKIKSYTYNNVDGKILIRGVIKNDGDLNAVFDKVSLTIPGCDILYQPKEVGPGEESELLLSCDIKETRGLKATLEYSSEKVGCTTTKNFKGTFAIGGCNADANCDDTDTCTTDSCADAATTTSHCSNKPMCENTDTSCGCTTCDNCQKMDWQSECSWTCKDTQTKKCTRTAKDYYCASTKTCQFTTDDASYTEKCATGTTCTNGVCGGQKCDINDGTWSKIPTMPNCGVKDTNKDGYYDVDCCNGIQEPVQIQK